MFPVKSTYTVRETQGCFWARRGRGAWLGHNASYTIQQETHGTLSGAVDRIEPWEHGGQRRRMERDAETPTDKVSKHSDPDGREQETGMATSGKNGNRGREGVLG